MLWMLMGIMFTLFLLNFPMFIAMILAPLAVIVTYFPNLNPLLATQQLIAGVSPIVLLAVPMFIFAADIMCAGQTSNRLLDFVDTFVGHIHGGMAITTAATCTIFGAISGSTQATVVAIGKPMRNRLLSSGYEDEDTTALIICSAIIALLIPPSISMIMYAVVTGASVGDLFIAGVLPGLLILLFFCVYNYFMAKKRNIPTTEKVDFKGKVEAFKKAIGPLGFPVVIFAGIYSGKFSPTEAAAIGVLYAAILELFLFKSIKIRDFKSIALSTAVVTTAVFILVAAGSLFSWAISYARIPQMITQSVLGTNPSAVKILVTVTIFFYIAGMFVDSIVAIVILTPIFFPLAMQAGIHPIHLGIIVTLQAALASVSPPFGCNIFTASAIFDIPFLKVVKRLPAYLLMLVVISVIIIFVPQLSLLLVP
ncbi:tripartite ATP-independent periplasmic transporter subunit DctM [Clostridium aceticum]|uniref:Tripartite ATP-independent periplasmic transporter subunit DctM n=1 Tax=Clostridium aceticum TaxID=84022 RepID=A0A0D8I858_9CLOT|nr:TRAP transporter large permease [Clostridium aceticum]AKL97234.1 tripartite ATP-independent periplasmic transporter subunit DctM [Clostridium aceticum]KJF26264.1 C4-dicarboxylate ABC transporter permease [Clostridium aceticum]